MNRFFRIQAIVLAAVMTLNLAACAAPAARTEETAAPVTQAAQQETAAVQESKPAEETAAPADTGKEVSASGEDSDNDLIILYTNDTHGHIDNYAKENEDGKKGLSFASVAAMKKELKNQGENVILVDAGDAIQGTVYSAVDEGREIIYMMNVAGYDLATLGNHEFDYNSFRMLTATAKAWFSYVSCNLYEISDGLPLFPGYEEFETKSGRKVAVIGIGTPESVITPVRFEDDKGNLFLDFYGRQDENDLYVAVQSTIDLARYYGADYVIALGHLGVDAASEGVRSTDLIAHVKGLDAFIDGHSHTTMEKQLIEDAEGKKVLLTQTGCHFAAFGKMTLKKDGSIDTELISDYDKYDPMVRKLEQRWIDTVNLQLGDEIASTDFNLSHNNPDNPEERIIRNRETNLGDICADAIYSYYNVAKNVECDLAIVNGGGIRAEVKKGPITYLDCKSVHPFGNLVCIIEIKGQQILDMLEWSNRFLGEIDPETGKEAEIGSFLHCAGMKYTTDTTIKDTESVDENGNWSGAPAGEYRTKDVMVFDKETGKYEPLDPERNYKVAGQNYLLRNLGGGLNMLAESELVEDFSGEDYIILSEYLSNFKKDSDGAAKITTEGSPLKKYEGYEMDYENPYGAGRITIIKE